MKKLAKAILIALGAVVVVGAVAILGVNVYIQSGAMHARIEAGLSKGLRTPVKVGGVSFMPWQGLKISGITASDPEANAQGDSLEIASVSVHPRLWKLLHHDVVIKQLTIDGVKVAWTQTPDGKWAAPIAAQAPAPENPPATAPAPQTAPPPAAVTPTPPPVTVEYARMRDAAFTFYDKGHKPIAALSGVTIHVFSPSDQQVNGAALVHRAVIQDAFYIDDWKGMFRYTPQELSLYDAKCTVGGGSAEGTVNVKPGEPDSPFSTDMKFSGVGIDRLLSDARTSGWQVTGSLSGFVKLQGNFRDSAATRGTGRIVLENASLAQSDLFDTLNELFHTDRFRSVPLRDCHADFHVADGNVMLDALSVSSPGIMGVTGQGFAVLKTGNLYIRCRLSIDPNTVRQIPAILMDNFDLDMATGARYVDFEVMGTVSHPTENLRAILRKKLQKTATDLWKKVIGGGKSSPTPPPAAQPAPPAQEPPVTPPQPETPPAPATP